MKQHSVISREFGFDMGHCLPDHKGGCYRPHGHRYRLEVFVSGDVVNRDGDPERGMVMDFGRVKQLVMEHVVDVLDHRFMMSADDPRLPGAIETFGRDCIIVSSEPPTAEWLADWIGNVLIDAAGMDVVAVRLWETPNCAALWEQP